MLKRNKDQEIERLGGVENYSKYKNELRHRVGRSEYEEHLTKISNDHTAEDNNGNGAAFHATVPDPVVAQGQAPGNAEAVVQKQERLVGYGRRPSGYAENKAETSEPVIGYQGPDWIRVSKQFF